MFLSIIIPVYNSEQYISECLDSCLDQDINDYEIICINDGSADNSLNILKEYSAKHRNIVLIDKENEGVSVARNSGLEISHGEYIMFVDADDLIQRNTLGLIKDTVSKKDSKRITIGVYEAQDEEIKVVLSWSEAPAPNRKSTYLWSSIYIKSIIDEHRIRFIRGITHGEDILFLHDFCNFCKDYDSFPYTVYYYRRNRYSATNTSLERNLLNCINSEFDLIELMKERYRLPEFRNLWSLEFWSNTTGSLLNEVSKLGKKEVVQVGKRLKDSKVCPQFHAFDYIWKGGFGTALILKNKSIWQRFFVLCSTRSFGYRLLRIRKQFNDSLFGYIIKHPKRFVRHPIQLLKKRRGT